METSRKFLYFRWERIRDSVDIAKAGVEHAKANGNNVVILDTAGRLHIDEDMMEELAKIKEQVEVHQTILVVDSMTGQESGECNMIL